MVLFEFLELISSRFLFNLIIKLIGLVIISSSELLVHSFNPMWIVRSLVIRLMFIIYAEVGKGSSEHMKEQLSYKKKK